MYQKTGTSATFEKMVLDGMGKQTKQASKVKLASTVPSQRLLQSHPRIQDVRSFPKFLFIFNYK